ncbi:MAG: PadR family transcriptional regulator [Terriglobales bacterium]
METNSNAGLLPGTLDLLILRALAQAERQAVGMHGYAVAEFIERRSEGWLRVEEGALYPALHRLEAGGWLAGRWGESENRRRAKFYRLTAAGRRRLEAETERWRNVSGAVGRVLAAEG